MKMYSEPKICHGGGAFDLSKRWYVYYSFRNPKTGKLERRPPLYYDVNKLHKNKKDRLVFLEKLKLKAKHLLEKGFNPYQIEYETKRAANDELDFALNQKRKLLKETTYRGYANRLGHFKKFLDKKGMLYSSIYEIKRKHVNQFPNERVP